MTMNETYGKSYLAYCEEIPIDEEKSLRSLFTKRFLDKTVLWYGYVEETTATHVDFVMQSIYEDYKPKVRLKFPKDSPAILDFHKGTPSYFKGKLKDFSSRFSLSVEAPDHSAILESNPDATYTANPYSLDLTFIQFEEYFGTFDYSPFQLKYDLYWKHIPIDVIGRFKEKKYEFGDFHLFLFVIDRPKKPNTAEGHGRDVISVQVHRGESGNISRFIREDKRLEIVVLPESREVSPHTFRLLQIVGPRLQSQSTGRPKTAPSYGNDAMGLS
ncbi:hypothetical protein BLNAU_8309 [Blattamonas nauphoetae]|uniref:Uncharacterized protein n=1 Tax=Blattamonas nauphoetae TaxID=2049346 RepID=A0ABQ9XYV6_9EUKA|nr:hypothetical protein BLNAU_8309 [Blattamonas nauphoetae]